MVDNADLVRRLRANGVLLRADREAADTIESLAQERDNAAARFGEAEEIIKDLAASLAAAISLLERGGKKAAPSDKMFDKMLVDYKNSLERSRAKLKRIRTMRSQPLPEPPKE